MPYRRILSVQDISCLGQCSMTVALPILSACGHEVCILPSALLSTHTGGFGQPAVRNFPDMMQETIEHWKRNGIRFDVIYTGYLGSIPAIDRAMQIMDTMLEPGGIIVADPAMADHGKMYAGLDEAYGEKMKALCMRAHVMLPNLTEAAMMTGIPYRTDGDENYIRSLLSELGGGEVVLTGVSLSPGQTGAAIRSGNGVRIVQHEKIPKSYHGTGDIFASALVGALACGKDLPTAAGIASEFTLRCIRLTFDNPAHWYGVKFEKALPDLISMLKE